jgi:FKBP-type peptidyl-prolyl cis-trans isomerase 2
MPAGESGERNRLPEPLEVGMQFEGMPDGDSTDEEAMIFTVTDIADDKVVLDGNHPLAGMALRFSLTVADARSERRRNRPRPRARRPRPSPRR